MRFSILAISIGLSFVCVSAHADEVSDAAARAERVLQEQLDQINAQRYAAGLPLITMDQIKRAREANIRRNQELEKTLQEGIQKSQEYRDAHGGCEIGFVPAGRDPAGRTACANVWANVSINPKGQQYCYPPRVLAVNPENNQLGCKLN